MDELGQRREEEDRVLHAIAIAEMEDNPVYMAEILSSVEPETAAAKLLTVPLHLQIRMLNHMDQERANAVVAVMDRDDGPIPA